MPVLAAEPVFKHAGVPAVASLMFFTQWLGRAIFASVAQTLLTTKLVVGLASILGFVPKYVTSTGGYGIEEVSHEQS